jgi:hypothetical protein
MRATRGGIAGNKNSEWREKLLSAAHGREWNRVCVTTHHMLRAQVDHPGNLSISRHNRRISLGLVYRFASFSSSAAAESLTKDDMKNLLKAAFTPTEDKIAQGLQFFDMTGGGEGITRMAFINGMTLLYGDLGHLAASPVKMPSMASAGDSPSSPSSFELGGLRSSFDSGYVMGDGSEPLSPAGP